ncbi:type II toxin-antitoxin system TacA family antitoxin [Rhodospirillum rubrum]|nr:DUF1778 domain-containing protein [Rhodospirillum rubrum]
MRLPDADLALIDRAATLRGRSRTDFVREAAVRAAEEVVDGCGLDPHVGRGLGRLQSGAIGTRRVRSGDGRDSKPIGPLGRRGRPDLMDHVALVARTLECRP